MLPKETNPSDVYESTAPGGGKCVTFYDPVDGFPFHLVWGQSKVEPLDPRFPDLKPNFVSGLVRSGLPVHRTPGLIWWFRG